MDLEVKRIASFLKEYLDYLDDNHSDLMREIGRTGVVSADQETELHDSGEQFLGGFAGSRIDADQTSPTEGI